MRDRVYVAVRRLSVCLSHRLTAAAAGLLLSALWAGDIDRQLAALAPRTSCRCAKQQWRRSSALSSKPGQCYTTLAD